MTKNLPEISIDIVSDVVCPWCLIGYRQIERAMVGFSRRAVFTLRWHPFQLAPDMPPGGQLVREYVSDRYGATPEQSRASRTRLQSIGEPLGVMFTFSDDSRIYNTHKAHELLMWSADSGRQTALKLALFGAYFTDAANIANDAVLLSAVSTAGLDPVEARAVIDDRRFGKQVDAEIAYWVDHNVTGVPAFIIDGKFMIPGAQDPDVFTRIFDRVIAAKE